MIDTITDQDYTDYVAWKDSLPDCTTCGDERYIEVATSPDGCTVMEKACPDCNTTALYY